MHLRRVLSLMQEQRFVSGSVLANELGVTRAAVNKQLAIARDYGVPIGAVKGRGYWLQSPVEWYELDELRHEVKGLFPAAEQVLYEEVRESTNQWLMRAEQLPAMACCDYQSAAHGRRGKSWSSPYAAGVYVSWSFTVDALQQVPAWLGLMVGVRIVRVLQELGVTDLRLKWPNDVQRDGAKLGGVLIEASAQVNGPGRVVVGVGVNLTDAPRHLALEQEVADCSDLYRPGFRQSVLIGLTRSVVPEVRRALRGETLDWMRDWDALDALRDREVGIEQQGQWTYGVAQGVNENGALRLRVGNESLSVQVGDVSLRPAR